MRRLPVFLLITTFLTFLFLSQTYRLRPRVDIPPALADTLNALATEALKNLEVPVGAVLVYADSIIGVGYNTVVRDTMVSGHAEINALNDAHRKNRATWKQLDPSKMVLYSTYEPCEMCKGAMLNLNIRHAVFEGPKPAWDHTKTSIKSGLYELKKQRLYAPDMQENLFRKHPGYHGH